MKKTKVCYVIVNCKVTGPMNQTLNIIKNLDSKFYEPSLITLFDEEENNSMIDDYKKIVDNCYCLHMNRVTSILYGKIKLAKLLKEINPDIIHALGMPPYRLSLGYKQCKHLVTLRNYAYEDYPSYYNKIIGPVLAYLDVSLIKKLIKKGKTFVTCSKSLTNIYEEREKIRLPFIRNGVDIDKYEKKTEESCIKFRNELGIPLDALVFIYTGPFNDRKDQKSAISGFLNSKTNQEKYLILCGDGINYELLKNQYKDKKEIIFTGKVSNVSKYLQLSDVYVSTSKSEGLPNSVLEAMATGLPVVLSDIEQHKELVEINSNIGLLYQLGNEKKLVDAIEKISSYDIKKMGEESYSCIVNNLTASIMSDSYQSLYKKIINSKR